MNECGLCNGTGFLTVAGRKTGYKQYKIGLDGPNTRKFAALCNCELGKQRWSTQTDDMFNDYRACLAIDFVRGGIADAREFQHSDGTPWSYGYWLDAMVFFHRFGEYPKWAGGSGKAERKNAHEYRPGNVISTV